MILLLNGPSSSGKTSLVRALQAAWEGPLVYLSLDAVIGMMPFHYTGNGPHAAEGLELLPASGRSYDFGPLGRRLHDLVGRNAALLSSEGMDVVFDHVIVEEDVAAGLDAALAGQDVFSVLLDCDEAELERRERVRRDRAPGLARLQRAEIARLGRRHDLLLDSTAASPDELATAIARGIEAKARIRSNAVT